MRKLLRPRLLIATVLVAALYYFLISNISITELQRPHPSDYLYYTVKMTQEFGPTLEEAEFEQTGVWLEELYRQADEIVRTDPRIASLGIQTYKGLREYYEETSVAWQEENIDETDVLLTSDWPEELKHVDDVTWMIFGQKTDDDGFLGWRIQTLESIRDKYISWSNGIQQDLYEIEYADVLAWWQEADTDPPGIVEWGELHRAVFPYISFCLVWVLLTLTLLIAPVLTRDRMARMDTLQYASQRGRRIYRSQLWAVLLTAFLLITILLGVCATALVKVARVDILWNNPMRSFMGGAFLVMPLTFGQYLLIMAAFAYALGLGAALALFCLSGYSRNLVKMVATAAVPVFVGAGILGGALLTWNGVFHYIKLVKLYLWSGVPLLEMGVPLLILIAGLAMALVFLRKRRKAEL